MSVYEDIVHGLQEAIEFEGGSVNGSGRTIRIGITERGDAGLDLAVDPEIMHRRISYGMDAYDRDGPNTPAEAYLKEHAVEWMKWLLHENLVLETQLEIAGWPRWKKDAYNANFATSEHATKI